MGTAIIAIFSTTLSDSIRGVETTFVTTQISKDRAQVLRALARLRACSRLSSMPGSRRSALSRVACCWPRLLPAGSGSISGPMRSSPPRRPGRPLRLRDQEPGLHRFRQGRGEGPVVLGGAGRLHGPRGSPRAASMCSPTPSCARTRLLSMPARRGDEPEN
jgi:hypothetical protein